MNLNIKYDVLKLNADENTADMIISLLSEKSLGSERSDSHSIIYFNQGISFLVERELNVLKKSFKIKWDWENLKSENWHLNWKENFKPIIIDDRFAIVPDWYQGKIYSKMVRIKPGMAFGTGHHESTYLMIEALLNLKLDRASVLDLGTGSGILSIVASILGAKEVNAVDYDSECESNFNENLKLNNLHNKINFNLHDVLNWNDFAYDYILVNINRNIIIDFLPKIKIKQGTVMFLSGILKQDYGIIEEICTDNKLKIMNQEYKGEWICLNVISNIN